MNKETNSPSALLSLLGATMCWLVKNAYYRGLPVGLCAFVDLRVFTQKIRHLANKY